MKKFTVYRHFDKEGLLLYIGRSINVMSRTQSHQNSRWFDQIDSIKLQHFDSETDMRIAEKEFIRNESPIYNVGINGCDLVDWRTLPRKKKDAI